MTLVTRNPETGMRHGTVRFPDSSPPTPDGCRQCGIPQYRHCRQWTAKAGWHAWTEPTNAQRLARMKARRKVQGGT